MSAHTNLAYLLRNMQPSLHDGAYAYCSWANDSAPDFPVLAVFQEREGTTLIVDERIAIEHNVPIRFRAAWITLDVHSELLAVGLLAVVTQALAAAGIACNVVSAVNHDHLFVPVDRATNAISVLEELSASAAHASEFAGAAGGNSTGGNSGPTGV
jgi:hypothetical protein